MPVSHPIFYFFIFWKHPIFKWSSRQAMIEIIQFWEGISGGSPCEVEGLSYKPKLQHLHASGNGEQVCKVGPVVQKVNVGLCETRQRKIIAESCQLLLVRSLSWYYRDKIEGPPQSANVSILQQNCICLIVYMFPKSMTQNSQCNSMYGNG